jgi:flagellar biosynthesis chaperone FliJ
VGEQIMGMSGWILDLQEEFEDKVADIVKESEHVAEAYASAIKLNKEKNYVNYSDDVIEELVDEMWSEQWSNYL